MIFFFFDKFLKKTWGAFNVILMTLTKMDGHNVSAEEDFPDIALCGDVIRVINDHLAEFGDQVHLSQVDKAWRHAVEQNSDEVWSQEWEIFKAKHQGGAPWFTEKVYNRDVPECKTNVLEGI